MELQPSRFAGFIIGAMIVTYITFSAIRFLLRKKEIEQKRASLIASISNSVLSVLLYSLMNDSLHIKSIVYIGCNFLWYRLSLRKIATQEDNQLLTSSQSSETDDDQSPIDHKEEQDPHINAIKK